MVVRDLPDTLKYEGRIIGHGGLWVRRKELLEREVVTFRVGLSSGRAWSVHAIPYVIIYGELLLLYGKSRARFLTI